MVTLTLVDSQRLLRAINSAKSVHIDDSTQINSLIVSASRHGQKSRIYVITRLLPR